jgi:hypothetical protein
MSSPLLPHPQTYYSKDMCTWIIDTLTIFPTLVRIFFINFFINFNFFENEELDQGYKPT